jgi:hypothetical protein
MDAPTERNPEMTAWNIVKFESKFVDGKIVHLHPR